MAKIIAGNFQTSAQADAARQALLSAGFSDGSVSVYHNNAPGQHGSFPVGGDEDADPEAKGAENQMAAGAVAGSVVGAGVGAVAGGPLGAAAGAGVGAFAGAFAGAMRGLGDAPGSHTLERRPAGVMVAVKLEQTRMHSTAVATMRDYEATYVEEAEGKWEDGEWADFDPVAPPHVVWKRGR
jgi:outer membrane lipoprotein SlyB